MDRTRRPRPDNRRSYMVVQTALGTAVLAMWMFVSVFVMDEDMLVAAVKALPFFAVYEFGVLSRYLPGVRQTVRTVETWRTGRPRM